MRMKMKLHYCSSRVHKNYFSVCVQDGESVPMRLPLKHTRNHREALGGESESESEGIEQCALTRLNFSM